MEGRRGLAGNVRAGLGGDKVDKNAREIENLYQLELNGIEEILDSFYAIDKVADSYFEPETQGIYLTEYGFETLPQLRELLFGMWKNEEHMIDGLKTLLAAAMKNKPSKEEGVVKRQENEELIPTFVYTF